jgi:ABC-2 type transport system permease protein
MLQNILAVARLHIKLVVSNRSVFIFSLIMPLLFTALMGKAKIAGTADPEGQKSILVVDEDGRELGARLIANLKRDESWQIQIAGRPAMPDSVRRGEASAGLIIPAGFTAACLSGETPALEVVTPQPPRRDSQLAAHFLESTATRFAASVNDARVAAQAPAPQVKLNSVELNSVEQNQTARNETGLQGLLDSLDRSEGLRQAQAVPGLPRGSEDLARRPGSGGINQSSPGMLVMFSLLFMVSGTNILIMERRRGTLRRLLVMPVSKFSILMGKLLGIYFTGVVQMTLLIVAGAVFFKVSWGRSPIALALMVLSFAFVATSLGILLATVARTVAQADALASIVVMTISALGGAWWPLDGVPRWLSLLGHTFPTAWAMDGFQDIIVRGQSLGAVLPEIAVLMGFTLLFLTLGLWRFRYE